MKLTLIAEAKSGEISRQVRRARRALMRKIVVALKEIDTSPPGLYLVTNKEEKPKINIKNVVRNALLTPDLLYTLAGMVIGVGAAISVPSIATAVGATLSPLAAKALGVILRLRRYSETVIKIDFNLPLAIELYIFKADKPTKHNEVGCGLWRPDRSGDFNERSYTIRMWLLVPRDGSISSSYDKIEYTLTHELVHRFQSEYNPRIFTDYVYPEQSMDEYYKHPSEVEAEYYSILHLAAKNNISFMDAAKRLDYARVDSAFEKFVKLTAERHPKFPFLYSTAYGRYLTAPELLDSDGSLHAVFS
jgi:hypothetical protein